VSDVELDTRIVDGILRRASDRSSYERFVAQGESCGWCSRPVRLAGHVVVVDAETGEREVVYSSMREPEGVLLKACGTRRATLCGSCAEVYRGDARQLVRAGLNGGKGVPVEISLRPAVFATLTAPSFGAVHRVCP
jgi:Replication initiator protein, pSAM2